MGLRYENFPRIHADGVVQSLLWDPPKTWVMAFLFFISYFQSFENKGYIQTFSGGYEAVVFGNWRLWSRQRFVEVGLIAVVDSCRRIVWVEVDVLQNKGFIGQKRDPTIRHST